MTKVVHCKKEKYDVYIGRPSIWGNPYSHLPNTTARYRVASREEAVAAYREYVKNSPNLRSLVPSLRGKVLGCWCAPKLCHGDVLKELADAE